MAISPELQKLLDTAWATMPVPVPYAQQPIQFIQPQTQVQQPVFQPIQIDTTLPTPYISNVPNFQPTQQAPIAPIQPLNFDGLMWSLWIQSWAWTANNTVSTVPNIIDNSALSADENIINKNLTELWYSSVWEAKTDIEATNEAAQGRWLFSTINSILPQSNPVVNTISDAFSNWFNPIDTGISAAKNFLIPKAIESAQELEQTTASKKAEKIKSVIWENVFSWVQKETENIRKDNENLWIQPNLWKVKFLMWQWTTNFTQSMTKGSSNFANVMTPYISTFRKREVDLLAQWRTEEAEQIRNISEHNRIQARDNLQRSINRISQLQQANPKLSDTQAADLAAQEEIAIYGSVNAWLLDWLKRLDWSIIDGKAIGRQIYEEREASQLWRNTTGPIITYNEWDKTWEDFLNNQANALDNDRINERSWDPLRIISSNLNRYIINPVAQSVARKIWEYEERFWINYAAADAWYLPWLWISERKKTSWDKIAAFTNEIFDILPELTTSIGWIALTLPLQEINLLKWVGLSPIWWLTKLNQAKAITNTLWWLWRLILWETIQNGVVDAFQQNTNSDINYYANLAWGILGSVPELINLWKQWKNFYSLEDMTWLIKNNYVATKAMKRAEEWRTRPEIQELKKWITDEQMIAEIGPINETKINELSDNIDEALKLESNIKQNILSQRNTLEQDLIKATDPQTREEITSQIAILDRANKEYNEWVNFQIGQQAAIKKLFTKDNLTPADVDEFARIIKTVLPNSRNEPLLRDQIINLAAWQRNIETQNALENIANTSSLKSSDSNYLMSQIEKTTWLQVGKSYTSSEIEDVLKKSESSSTQRWLSEKNADWELRYFNKLDWKDYILNDAWLAKLNLTEVTPNIRIQREMASLQEWTESARYLDIVENNKEVFWITDDEINQIKEWDVYNSLLEQIDNFIPCIR